jgi:hypothetical protein
VKSATVSTLGRPAAVQQRRTTRWLATAPHYQPRHIGTRSPWGKVHVRLDGATETACGERCVGWHVFWDISLGARMPNACRGCAEAMVVASRRAIRS